MTEQQVRRPGTQALTYGLVALPLGALLVLVLPALAPDTPALGLLGLLLALSGLVALIVGGVARVRSQ